MSSEISVQIRLRHGSSQRENIYTEKLSSDGVIIIGNESHGISDDILQMINCPITIPCFANTDEVESLNASVACGIILSEFKRR
ncbi:MAG: hypothetical protein IJ681_05185, partial [Bacteroidales bacterium]|nr:hypothetical protein [Bacteroidales bacterium]